MRTFALLAALVAVLGCKGTEDYLADLQTTYDRQELSLRSEVYDAGQLVHEAFAGLAEQEVLTLSQMARSVAHAGYVVAMDQDPVPLCQAQAVLLIARIAERYPVPPISKPFVHRERAEVQDVLEAAIKKMDEQQGKLEIASTLIPSLSNPDRAVVELSLEKLRRATGMDFGRDVTAWEQWYEENKAALEADIAAQSAGPLTDLAEARFDNLKVASALLNLVGLRIAVHDIAQVRDLQERAVLRIARQVVVLAIQRALMDPHPEVRGAGALAAARVVDPAFADVLGKALVRERDPIARARIIQAMQWYPRKDSIAALILQLDDHERTVAAHAHAALVSLTGEDHGREAGSWALWWDTQGKSRWP